MTSSFLLPLPMAELTPLPQDPESETRALRFEDVLARAEAIAAGPGEALLPQALTLLPELAELCRLNSELPFGPFLHPALEAIQQRLFSRPGEPAAWLEALSAHGLTGSRQRRSPLALDAPFERFPTQRLCSREVGSWIDAGLMVWITPEDLSRFCERFPDALDPERADWAIESLRPPAISPGSPLGQSRRFEIHLARAMIASGSFYRLAPVWLERSPNGASRAIEELLDADAELAQNKRPALFNQDPVYERLLAWSAQRLASKVDFLTVYGDPHAGGNRPRRAPDFSSALLTLLLDLCRAHQEADAIGQAASNAPAARRPAL